MKLIATGLAGRGHRVFYVTHRASRGSQKGARNFGVELISYRGPIGWHRHRMRLALSFLVLQLLATIVSRRVSSVYCFYEVFSVAPLMWIGKILPKLFITMRIAGLSWREVRRRSPWHQKIYEAVFERVDQVNYIHPDLKPVTEAKCRQWGISLRRARVFIGDIGIPVHELKKIAHKEQLNNVRFTAVVPTRFSAPKRQELIVQALALIPAGFEVTVQFVGEGKLKTVIEKMARDLLPPDRYEFLGFVSQERLWELIGAADLVMLPTDYEGLSKVTLESMAIGTPVMASKVLPLDNYVTSYETGFLVENTPEAWADALTEVLSSPKKLAAIMEPAQQFVTNNYSSAKNLALYENKLIQPKTPTKEEWPATNPPGRIPNPE